MLEILKIPQRIEAEIGAKAQSVADPYPDPGQEKKTTQARQGARRFFVRRHRP